MAIDLTALFTKLGHIAYTLDTSLNGFRGTSMPSRIGTIQADYAAPDLDLVDSIRSQLASWQGSAGSIAPYLRQLAQATVIRAANNDRHQPDQTLATALGYLIDQMAASSASVKRSTVSASVATGSANVGDGVIVASMADESGVPLEYAFAEMIEAEVTSDAPTSGATAGRESVTFRGQYAVADTLSWLFPAGSGATSRLQAASASVFNGSGTANQLSNGTFETWTVPNTPDSWHIATGTAGTSVLKSTAQHYDGAASLQFAGDGSELTAVYTELGVDTKAAVKPLDALCVNLWLKTDGTPGAGVLEVALVDGSGTVINDESGTPNRFTVDLTTAGTAWVARSGAFRTPAVLPSSVRLRLKLSTALSAGIGLYMDRAALARPTALYAGGPRLAVFSGATNFLLGDSWTMTVANDFGGLLQSGMDRLMGMRQLDLILPSAVSPTISDSLVA